jgi:hypothetical protein
MKYIKEGLIWMTNKRNKSWERERNRKRGNYRPVRNGLAGIITRKLCGSKTTGKYDMKE